MKKMIPFFCSFYLLLSSGFLLAQPTPVRVACVGNSITFGGLGEQSYPQQLGKLLGSHYVVKNFGVSGTTMLKKGDFPYWQESVFITAQDFNPHILILTLGTNDSKPQNWIFKNDYYGDYLDMIRVFRAINPNLHILAGAPPPVFKDGSGITNSIIRDEIIPIIREVRKTAKTDSINFYDQMLDKSSMFPDGIHPDATGYAVMANIAYSAIINSPSGIIRYFNAKPAEFELGDTCVLYWETSSNSQATINDLSVPDADSMTIYPSGNRHYTLTTHGVFCDSSKLSLTYLPPGRIKRFTANPLYLDQGSGDSTRLEWSATKGSSLNGSCSTGEEYMECSITCKRWMRQAGQAFSSAKSTAKGVWKILAT